MPVNTAHPQYGLALERWRTTRDACDPEKIKDGQALYLPHLADHEDDPERYKAYLARAYYINVTGRTRDGLVGATFRRDPTATLPNQIAYMSENVDGAGMSLNQLGKGMVSDLLVTGRYGLLADFPEQDSQNPSREQTQSLRAYIARYRAEDIINWRFMMIEGSLVLTLVVLTESENDDEADEFSHDTKLRYRVLRLSNGVYSQQRYDESFQPLEDERVVLQADGSPWRRIPFHFAGSIDNQPSVDPSPLYDLAVVNIAQYRNIADYEENLHIHGQGTLFISTNIDFTTYKEANPSGIRVGARTGHFLGANGKAELVQVEASSAGKEAIEDKADQMVAIGARLITTRSANQTAEAARINASGEHSVLSTLVGNVSEAIEAALEDACLFMGADPDELQYQLNRDFWEENANPQLVVALIQSADRGDIAQTDLRAYYRRTGLIEPTRTDQAIDQDLLGQGA